MLFNLLYNESGFLTINMHIKVTFRILIITLGVLASLVTISGQNYGLNVNHYNTEQGLSHRDAQCITKDKIGFLWVGTKLGVNRFDGQTFKVYTQTEGLQSNEINHIIEDNSGKLFMFETGSYLKKEVISLSILDPVIDKVVDVYSLLPDGMQFNPTDIKSFTKGPNGLIWFLMNDGLVLKWDGKHFSSIKIDISEVYLLDDMHVDGEGNIYLIVKGLKDGNYSKQTCALFIYKENGTLVKKRTFGVEGEFIIHDIDSSFIRVVHSDLSINRFYKIDSKGNEAIDSITSNILKSNHIENNNITRLSIIMRKGKELFFLSGSDLSNYKLKLYSPQIENLVSINNKLSDIRLITSIYIDKGNTIWLATQFGIYELRILKYRFENIVRSTKDKTIALRNITSDSSGIIYLKTESTPNIWKYDPNSKKLSILNDEIPLLNKYIDKDRAISLFFNTQQQLIFGSADNIYNLDFKTKRITIPLASSDLKFDGAIWSFYEDPKGRIWFGNAEGRLGVMIDQKAAFLEPISEYKQLTIYQFIPFELDKVILVTSKGLYIYNTETFTVLQEYSNNMTGNAYLEFDNINHLYKDVDGTYWAGSKGNGLLHLKIEYSSTNENSIKILAAYNKSHGFIDNNIYTIYPDEYGKFWMSSDHGIISYDKVTKRVNNYATKDGMINLEYNRISHHQAKDGYLYFGGLNGASRFHPLDFKNDTISIDYPLVITNYEQINSDGINDLGKKEMLYSTHKIVFEPNDRFFRIDFRQLAFDGLSKNNYAYKFEGIDQDWNVQDENFIKILNLPYGSYNLRIRAQNLSGVWSKKELNIQIEVIKPFYLMAWFIAANIALSLGLMYVYFVFRTSSLRRKKQQLEKEVFVRTEKILLDKIVIEKQAEQLKSLDKLKTHLFANISHELRTPISLIIGPVQSVLKDKSIAAKNVKLLELAEKNSKILNNTITEILDLAKLENKKIKPSNSSINLYQHLVALISSYQQLAMINKLTFNYEFNLDQNLEIITDASKLNKILSNYLSNAFKYANRHGVITLNVSQMENDLLFSVQDTGRGIHPADLPHVFDRFYQASHHGEKSIGGTGIGLSLVKELSKILKGKVWVESKMNSGSTFYLSIPLKVEYLTEGTLK